MTTLDEPLEAFGEQVTDVVGTVRVAELNTGSHTEESASSSDDDGSATLALVLGAVGAGLGGIALVVSLARRRA